MATSQEKEITTVDELDQEDIFHEEGVPSSQNASDHKPDTKMSPEEVEKYDRLIQVGPFPLQTSNWLGGL